ncbi:MAG TPA: FliH/SctL family protein [Candidatus Eisenbacteria bacterium]|nr:FliH/SctL family protein [Candidatus Eisenbacteria bacterium]
MSTSPRRALDRADAASPPGLQPFPYDVVAAASRPDSATDAAASAQLAVQKEGAREIQRLAEVRHQAKIEAEKMFEEQLARERSGIANALATFTRDRAAYFEKIEGEVVQLALSIARKILHREAQLDPLLLAGIVRVALEKIDKATGVILRIHPQNMPDWHRYLSTHLDPADLPEIAEDPSQPLDGCVLETSMGAASLGLDVQLKEIEQGLMDLLAARPGAQQ